MIMTLTEINRKTGMILATLIADTHRLAPLAQRMPKAATPKRSVIAAYWPVIIQARISIPTA